MVTGAHTTRFFTLSTAPASLIEAGHAVVLEKNREVLSSGKEPVGCYYLLDGLVGSFKLDSSGNESFIIMLEGGNLFGEANLLLNTPMTCTFRVIDDANALYIESKVFQDLMQNDIEVANYVAWSVSLKMLAIRENLDERRCTSVMWRTCNLFLELSTRQGNHEGERVQITYKLTQQHISMLLGVNRVTVTNNLRQLKEMKLIEKVNDFYFIVSQQRLTDFMNLIA
jgi:CRP/FNR family transcriptional regulator